MGVYFFDSSAIAKHYVRERGSDWLAGILDPAAGNRIHLAGISGVEVVAAITRRVRIGSISSPMGAEAIARFRGDFAALARITEISAPLISRAMDLAEKHALRGYDAVQLAAALAVQEGAVVVGLHATIISADDELNAAAMAEGLLVENPQLH